MNSLGTDGAHDSLASTYEDELLGETVPFWLAHGIDRRHGGVLTCLDRDGTPYDTDKSVWFQGRFGWLLGELCATFGPREDWLAACRSCVDFLRRHCFDTDGRMFFAVTREGLPLRKRRYVFSEMFAAMALASWGAAANDRESADEGVALFERAAARLYSKGGIEPKVVPRTRPVATLSAPIIVLGTAQAIRVSVARLPDGAQRHSVTLDSAINAAIEAIRTHFVRPELEVVLENVLADGSTFLDHADGRLVNPGHAIEGAWFVMEEGHRRGDRSLVDLGTRMLEWSWRLGWDDSCGGLLSLRDVAGKPCTEYWHDMKFWWPHAEAEIAMLMAWRLTADDVFRRRHADVREWSRRHFHDSRHGEWFGWLRRDGTPTHHAKGSLWKGPFHIPRMQLVCRGLLVTDP
ncbi:MAG: AGE family epimerase/isomerase [Planctomycetaceae bacterium]